MKTATHWLRLGKGALSVACCLAGSGGLAQVPGSGDPAVTLQRFVVTATPIPKHPWRYTSFPGVEVLSRASDEKAGWWARGVDRGIKLQSVLLPESLTSRLSTPSTLIIDDTDTARAPPQVSTVAPTVGSSKFDHGELMPDVQLSESFPIETVYDDDTLASQSNLYGINLRGALIHSAWNLDFRLLSHAPAVPEWLRQGLIERYGLWGPDVGGFIPDLRSSGDRRSEGEPDTCVSRTQFWVNDDLTRRLQRFHGDKGAAPPFVSLIPFEQVFSSAGQDSGNSVMRACQSALFVRWALIARYPDPGRHDPYRSAAFWRFVEGVSRQPATEAFFRDCFGMGYADLERELLHYLPSASREQVAVTMPRERHEMKFRLATNDEVGRILGDWLRMKAEMLHKSDPSLSKRYLGQAGIVLMRAYRGDLGIPAEAESPPTSSVPADSGRNSSFGSPVAMQPLVVSAKRIRDPGLLAVFGLYEADIGDEAKARELLEEAAKAGVQRPEAYRELAEERFADAVAHPAGRDRKFSYAQTQAALEPLAKARQMTPPSRGTYDLIAEIWRHSEAKPSAGELAAIDEAVALYPDEDQYRSARARLSQ